MMYPVVDRPVYVARDQDLAAQLDAADGVMDGRYHGAPIAAQRGYGPSGSVSRSQRAIVAPDGRTAAELDAADGVMDGTYFGSSILRCVCVCK